MAAGAGDRGRGRSLRPRRLDGIAQMYLAVESPATPMHFGALVVLDGAGLLDDRGALPLACLRARLGARVLGIAELRHAVRPVGPLAGAPLWADDRDFRIERHIVEVRLPSGAADDVALLAFAETLMAPVFDRAHPLWRLWCITGLADRRLGLLFACHHSLTDGLGAVRLARGLLDDSGVTATVTPAPTALPEPLPRWRELVLDHARHLADRVHRSRDPSVRRKARRVIRAFIAGWLATRHDAPTSLNDAVGPRRRSSLIRFDQATMRSVARAYGAAVNDVVLALVVGGIRDLLAARGERMDHLAVRAGIAVALPPSERRASGGNQFGGYAIELPFRERDPAVRVLRVAAAYARARRTQRVTGTTAVRAWAARFPVARAMMARQRYIQVMETLLPGPPRPMKLLGAPVLDVLPMQPLGRNVGLTFTAATYAGRLSMVVRTDPVRFPDLDRLTAAIERDWAILAAPPTATG